MKNTIRLDSPIIENNKIICKYDISGEWSEAFNTDVTFWAEYSIDVSSVPESIAIIPFLSNILPISWVYDAEIIVNALDKDFYESIPQFKKGYKEMYPMIDFKGTLTASDISNNQIPDQKGAITFFSGGADAFNTLVQHIDEKPALITLWGADVKLDDIEGWNKVERHITETAQSFDLEYIIVKSTFRTFLDEWKLTTKVDGSGDNWWHGFQHGVGIISHAAPVVYAMKKKSIYFASSFTVTDKGKYKCASDPTIDNFIHFSGADVIHDGYELSRQDKIQNIVSFVKNSGKKLSLRVCWESTGGSNCCNCEKCWRTIIALYAEKADPKQYGFQYDDFGKLMKKVRINRDQLRINSETRYLPIQKALHENYSLKSVDKNLKWLYNADISHLGDMTILQRFERKAYNLFN